MLGNGGFGTAMALVAHRAGNQVSIWGHDGDYTREVARSRANPRYLDGVAIPDDIDVTADGARALDSAEVVLSALPTQHVRETVGLLAPHVPAGAAVVSLSKGLEQGTGMRPTQILQDVLHPSHPVLALSGPSHAEEIAHDLPCTVVLAGDTDDRLRTLQEALSHGRFRIYRNQDILGIELCGAVKNVMALAAGIADGLGFGDNAKAAILSRGIVEMCRFGMAEGAREETFFGLAGVGDLAVTAFSAHGRNRAFGERIGRGESLDAILESTHKVAEGVWTSRVVRKRARELAVDMPLCEAVCQVLFEGVAPTEAVQWLMARDAKAEG